MKRAPRKFVYFACLAGAALLACVLAAVVERYGSKRVQGPGVQPQIGFACCEHGIGEAQALIADPEVIADLKSLHATVALPTLDFTEERAALVRRLNEDGIPVVGWLMLTAKQGYYFNSDNAPQAAARFNAFEAWTRAYRLRWAGVGLDIEPDFAEFAALKGHRWRLATMLLKRSVDGGSVVRAQRSYAALIRRIQTDGYIVQTYQMPFIADERIAHSTLVDRLLGTVNVRGNEEYMMLYTSFAPSIGAGILWELGPHSQGITVGSTEGDPKAGARAGGLDWEEFSRDLIVASHFSHHIGVYDLEGCVQQGFLTRLKTMEWGQSVVIPATSIRRAGYLGLAIRMGLWIGGRIVWIGGAALLLIACLAWKWRFRGKKGLPPR